MTDRKAIYNPEADRRWSEKNPERRKYLSHRSRARSFIRDAATMEDLDELTSLIAARRAELEKTAAQDCARAQVRDAADQ